MAEGRRGLGRGLSALLDEVEAASTPEGRRAAGVLDIAIDLIRPNPDQPRKAFGPEELDELADSIRERGVLQPILVRPFPGKPQEYQIIAGERRWRAAQRAGLKGIPALVRDLADQEVMEVALIENIQRADLNALEEARAYETMAARFDRAPEAIAKVVGKSRSHVANTLRLMRLPPAVQDHLVAGRLSAGHARALLDLDDAVALAERVIDQGLNVRQTEALARSARAPDFKDRSTRPAQAGDADTLALQADLEDLLGLKVQIRDRNGVGEVRIAYQSLEQLDDLCRRLSQPLRG
jgi:ParB family chromosome partitioning protein